MNDYLVAWAAGIFEGEGHADFPAKIHVTQKKRWLVYRLRDLFGGRVFRFGRTTKYYRWQASGDCARAFLTRISPLLSPHKFRQVSLALEAKSRGWVYKPGLLTN